MAGEKLHQWEGGCINCGAPRDLSPPEYGQDTQLYLVRDDGNKTIVGFCKTCYGLNSFDYEKLRDNLAKSEMDCARASGKSELVEHAKGFAALKFVGHEKRGHAQAGQANRKAQASKQRRKG